jgi:serine phosphatase RsbU (regulator of sigma subunit)
MNDTHTLEDLRRLTVLYVEDEETIRNEVAYFLARRVGKILTAANGREGLDLFMSLRPDLVVSDIQMPVMNGLDMATEIKRLERETPVIFTTAFNDTNYLQIAISLGIDGYVLKPIDLEQLMQVTLRCVDILMQSREIAASRAQLAAYHRAAEEERQLVAELMTRMMRTEHLRDKQLRHWLRPTELVGGDLVAAARGRNNKLYLMLADSTGHGLPAALNLLPINHIFYSMVSKNLPVSLIVEEMNWAVHDQSPVDRYVTAFVACIDTRNRLIEVWNGGLPSALFVDDSGQVVRAFESDNFPLGILDRTFVAETEVFQWHCRGRLVIFSDGLEDAEDEVGRAFGRDGVIAALRAAQPGEQFDAVVAAVQTHMGTRNAFDDMTLLMVENEALAAETVRQP